MATVEADDRGLEIQAEQFGDLGVTVEPEPTNLLWLYALLTLFLVSLLGFLVERSLEAPPHISLITPPPIFTTQPVFAPGSYYAVIPNGWKCTQRKDERVIVIACVVSKPPQFRLR